MKLPKKVTGVVFYEGASMLNGKRIVGIMLFASSNDKTG